MMVLRVSWIAGVELDVNISWGRMETAKLWGHAPQLTGLQSIDAWISSLSASAALETSA